LFEALRGLQHVAGRAILRGWFGGGTGDGPRAAGV